MRTQKELDLMQYYDFGGWLRKNLPLMGTLAGAALAIPTGGMSLGLGAMLGRTAGQLGGSFIPEEEPIQPQMQPQTIPQQHPTQRYSPELFNPRQFYSPTFQYGGDLTEYEGPSHEAGGIPIGRGAEVEGGETRYGDTINSDRIVINKETAEEFGLPKVAIGMTVAQYTRYINRRHKREGDEMSDEAREEELSRVSEMSRVLAERREREELPGKGFEAESFAYGGLTAEKAKIMLREDRARGKKLTKKQKGLFGLIAGGGKPTRLMHEGGGDLLGSHQYGGNIKPWMWGEEEDIQPLGIPAAPEAGLALEGGEGNGDKKIDWGNVLTGLLGIAPIGISAGRAIGSMFAQPEEVDYERIEGRYEPVTYDPRYALSEASRAYGKLYGELPGMARGRKGKWMQARIQGATEEAATRAGITQKYAEMTGRERAGASQMEFYRQRENARIAMQEQIDRAANVAAVRNLRSGAWGTLGTQMGQLGRDRRLREAQGRYLEQLLPLIGQLTRR